jgi:hypothetical protein
MPGFEHGYKRAITEIITGIVMGILLSTLESTGLIPPSYIFPFKLTSIIGVVSLILAMPYWGTGYLLGWLLGVFVLMESGLVGIFDFIVYFVAPFAILLIRFMRD